MTIITLTRQHPTDQGTPGVLECGPLTLFTMELPWRENARRISCIPAGNYHCRPYSSAKYPDVYHVDNVPGRSAVLIHKGNWAGDVSRGFRTDSAGCILIGTVLGTSRGQAAVLGSAEGLKRLHAFTGRAPFTLRVLWASGATQRG